MTSVEGRDRGHAPFLDEPEVFAVIGTGLGRARAFAGDQEAGEGNIRGRAVIVIEPSPDGRMPVTCETYRAPREGRRMSGIEVRNVVKSFGATSVLKGVSLDVAPGEFVSLVGPSGCGKTTLMRIVAGLETADGGTIAIADRDVTGIRAADRDVAMVFQNYALYPHLTARQNIAVPLVMRTMTAAQRLPFVGRYVSGSAKRRAEIQDEVARTAEMLAIGHLLDRKPAQLSGGQRQRVALARAIVRRPMAFLMDEPLSNLDASLRVHTRKEIVDLHRRVGASTIYVTHDQAEAMTMSDRVAVMMEGELLQVGSPEEIYLDPQDLRVAAFVGSPRINTLPADVGADGQVRVGGVAVGLGSKARGVVTLAMRAETLSVARTGGIPAIVEHVEFLGEAVLLHARHASGETLIARLDRDDRPRLARGEEVRLEPKIEQAFLFDAAGKRVPATKPVNVAALEVVRG
jgi:multiple sugar transport system ATP-binding protein